MSEILKIGNDPNVNVLIDLSKASDYCEIGLRIGEETCWTSSRNALELVENRWRAQEGGIQSEVSRRGIGFIGPVSECDEQNRSWNGGAYGHR
jgi:hypothetical protein